MLRFAIGISCVAAIGVFAWDAFWQAPSSYAEQPVIAATVPRAPGERPVLLKGAERQNVATTNGRSRSAKPTVNTEAAKRVRRIIGCIQLQNSRRRAEELLSIPTATLNSAQLEFHDAQLGKASHDLDPSIFQNSCDDIDESEARNDLYPALLEAARAGDWDAASCYTISPYDAPDDLLTADGVAAYRAAARTFIVEGMRRGDWRFVTLAELAVGELVMRHPGQFKHSLFHRLITPDKKMEYGYVRLERLGAMDAYADQLDAQLDAMAVKLPEADIEEMNRWAAEEYRINFARTSKNQESPSLCNLR